MLMLPAPKRESGYKMSQSPVKILYFTSSFLTACLKVVKLVEFLIWLLIASGVEKNGHTDVDEEDVMIIVPPVFAPKDVPENLV